MPSHMIVTATTSDRDRTIATLLTAFAADPFTRWVFPEPLQYLTYFRQVLEVFAGHAFESASAYRSEDFRASAFWLPHGIRPDEEALGAIMQNGVNEALQEDAFSMLEQMNNSHPQSKHWYLPFIDVDPVRQDAGYGSALLDYSLELCDRDHLAAYLDSTNLRNVPLYERFGFEVIGEIQVGSSPPVLPMLRAART